MISIVRATILGLVITLGVNSLAGSFPQGDTDESQQMHLKELDELAAALRTGDRTRRVLWGFIRLSRHPETKERALRELSAVRQSAPRDLAVAQAYAEALLMASEYEEALDVLPTLIDAACGSEDDDCTAGERRFLSAYIAEQEAIAQGSALLQVTEDPKELMKHVLPMMENIIRLADEVEVAYEVPKGLYWPDRAYHPAIEIRLMLARELQEVEMKEAAVEVWNDSVAACWRVRSWEDCDAIEEAIEREIASKENSP